MTEAATTEPSRIGSATGRLEREAARARAASFFVEHGELVRRVCVGLLRDRHEAEDAAQQTFLSAYRSLAEGTEPREPAAWLATIARNECLLRIRARMRAPMAVGLEEEAASSDVHGEAVSRSHARRLWREIRSLPDQQRDAVILREFAGLSYEELAVALGISKPAVESLLFRARGRLRERLEAAFATLNVAGVLSTVADAAARLVSSGAAQPAAAKIVAAGAAAALVGGGGAVVADHVGPPHHSTQAAARPAQVAAPRPVAAAPAAAPVAVAGPTTASPPVRPLIQVSRGHAEDGAHAAGRHDGRSEIEHRGDGGGGGEHGHDSASVTLAGSHADGSREDGRRTVASETTDGHEHADAATATASTAGEDAHGGDSGSRDGSGDSGGDGGGTLQPGATVPLTTTTTTAPQLTLATTTAAPTTTAPTTTSGGDGGSSPDG